MVFQNRLKGFLSNAASTTLVPSYSISWWHLYVAFTLKIFICLSSFLYFNLILSLASSFMTKWFSPFSLLLLQLKFISKNHVSRLMKDQSSFQNTLPECLYKSATYLIHKYYVKTCFQKCFEFFKKDSFIKKSVEQSKNKECKKLYHKKGSYESFSGMCKYSIR